MQTLGCGRKVGLDPSGLTAVMLVGGSQGWEGLAWEAKYLQCGLQGATLAHNHLGPVGSTGVLEVMTEVGRL